MRTTWFCVDIECSGTQVGHHACLSLGAVVVRCEGEDIVVGDRLYLEIDPADAAIDDGAMAVNGLSIERLRREGISLKAALVSLTDFVNAQCSPGTKPTFVGHNAPFDWSFVNHDYQANQLKNPFGYKALDTKALAAGVLGWHWLDTSKEALAKALDLVDEDPKLAHRADYDAWYQALILVGLLERMPPQARA